MAQSRMQGSNQTDRLADRAEEAEVPDLLRPEEIQRERFTNTNSYRNPGDLVEVFNYNETYEPFTIDEELTFAQAFKSNPKDFAAIAEFLPDRTREECLKHYYDKKADGRFKTESPKQREARKGPRKDMYDYGDEKISSAAELVKRKGNRNTIPINQEIKRLQALLGEDLPQLPKRNALGRQRTVILPRPDLSILQQGFRPPLEVSDEKLLVWLRAVDVLLLLKQWKELCLDVAETKAQMEKMLRNTDRPWMARVDTIADHAVHYGDQDFEAELTMMWAKAFVLCANFAARVVKCNRTFFESLKSNRFSDMDQMIVAVAALFTVYDDVGTNENGFFGTLLDSPLAKPIARDVRKEWEAKYLFEGDGDDDDIDEDFDKLVEPKNKALPPHVPTRRPQRSSRRTNAPSKPACNSRVAIGFDTEIDIANECKGDSSDSNDGIGEPRDVAGKANRAKAHGLYHAMKKMSAELKEVKAQRDSYMARLDELEDELEAEPKRGSKNNRRKEHGAKSTENVEEQLKMMTDANVQLQRDDENLRKALSLRMRGQPASSAPMDMRAEDYMRALMQAQHGKLDQQANKEAGEGTAKGSE